MKCSRMITFASMIRNSLDKTYLHGSSKIRSHEKEILNILSGKILQFMCLLLLTALSCTVTFCKGIYSSHLKTTLELPIQGGVQTRNCVRKSSHYLCRFLKVC